MSSWIELVSTTSLGIIFSESFSLSSFLPNLPAPHRLIGVGNHEGKKEKLTRGVELRGEMFMSSLHLGSTCSLIKEEALPAEDGEGVPGSSVGGDTGDNAPFWKEPNSEKMNGEALPGFFGVTQRGFWFG